VGFSAIQSRISVLEGIRVMGCAYHAQNPASDSFVFAL
jgi:hypothetical protein